MLLKVMSSIPMIPRITVTLAVILMSWFSSCLVSASTFYTWEFKQTGEGPIRLFSVAATGSSDVWFGGGGATIQRFDGTNWNSWILGENCYVSAIYPLSPTNVYATTTADDQNQYWNTNIYHFNGSTWTKMDRGHNTYWLNSIWAQSDEEAWTCGGHTGGGSLWKWNTSELKWMEAGPSGYYDVWQDLCMVGKSVWVAGNQGHVGNNNGSGWSVWTLPDLSPTFPYVRSITAIADNDVWAIGTPKEGGNSTALYHYDGGSWSRQLLDDVVTDIFAINASNIWGAGRKGLWQYDGLTWKLLHTYPDWAPSNPRMWATDENIWVIDIARFSGIWLGEVLWGKIGTGYSIFLPLILRN